MFVAYIYLLKIYILYYTQPVLMKISETIPRPIRQV